MPEQENQAVEAMINEGGPNVEPTFDPRPDVNEVVQTLQNHIAQLTLELAVSRLSLAKAMARIQDQQEQAPEVPHE